MERERGGERGLVYVHIVADLKSGPISGGVGISVPQSFDATPFLYHVYLQVIAKLQFMKLLLYGQ